MRKIQILFFAILGTFIFGCTQNDKNASNTDNSYFDLRGFFQNEIKKLQRVQPSVLKSVSSNGKEQHKELKIGNWANELSVFTDADINKSAWRGFFRTESSTQKLTYTVLKKEIPVKLLAITKDSTQNIKHIRVLIEENNFLYHSIDTLDWYTDSLYVIKKWQKTRFLSESAYSVKGKILDPKAIN